MSCVQCGAELRPGARFCNRCGALQPDSTSSSAAQPAVAVDMRPDEQPEDASQVKRPPRPVRQDDGEDAAGEAGGSDEEDARSAAATYPVPVMPPLAELGESAGAPQGDQAARVTAAADLEVVPLDRLPSSPTADQPAPATPPPPAATVPEQPEQEAALDETPGAPEPVADARSAVGAAALPDQEAPSAPDATPGTSWPLAAGTLAGGRYRIERVSAASQDAPGAENTYLVTDRRGYERCWSCGAEPGSASASDPFCERCGADLLAREYVMTERRLGAPDDEKTMPLGGGEPGAITFVEAGRLYRVAPRPAELPAFPAGAYLVAGAACDIGISRHSGRNEDSLGVTVLSLDSDSRRHTLGIFVVADGLGGHANGHEASQAVARVFTDSLLRALALPLCEGAPDPTPDALHEALLAAAHAANVALLAANDATGADSGSTLAAALVWDETAYVANVGDSRGYVFGEGTLRRLTIDHSLVESLVAGGIIAPEDRYTHPERNKILRSLGDERRVAVDVFEQRLRPGMRLLLCSDGLWEMVRDDELAHILVETPHPQEAADMLVRAANAHGGEDNISAIVVEVRA